MCWRKAEQMTRQVKLIGCPRRMARFISEDETSTFEGWLEYQRIDQATRSRMTWRRGARLLTRQGRSLATPKVGLMKLQPVPGEPR